MPVEVEKGVNTGILQSKPIKTEAAAKIIEEIRGILFSSKIKPEEIKGRLDKIFKEYERAYNEIKNKIKKLKEENKDGEMINLLYNISRDLRRINKEMEDGIKEVTSDYEATPYKITSEQIKKVFDKIKKLEEVGWKVNLNYKEGERSHYSQPKIINFEGENKYEEMNKIVMKFVNLSSKIGISENSYLNMSNNNSNEKSCEIWFEIPYDRVGKGDIKIYGEVFLDITINEKDKTVNVGLSNVILYK